MSYNLNEVSTVPGIIMRLVLMQNTAVLKWKSKITVILSSDIQNPSDVYEKFKQKT